MSMKNIINLIRVKSTLVCGMTLLFSCSLKEYNPGGTTADVVFAVEEGMNCIGEFCVC